MSILDYEKKVSGSPREEDKRITLPIWVASFFFFFLLIVEQREKKSPKRLKPRPNTISIGASITVHISWIKGPVKAQTHTFIFFVVTTRDHRKPKTRPIHDCTLVNTQPITWIPEAILRPHSWFPEFLSDNNVRVLNAKEKS